MISFKGHIKPSGSIGPNVFPKVNVVTFEKSQSFRHCTAHACCSYWHYQYASRPNRCTTG